MARNLFDLTGKVSIVTGGNSGLGLAFARGLARQGSNLVIWGRAADKLERAEQELRAFGVEVVGAKVDVSIEEEVKAGFQDAVKHFGRIDCAVAAIIRALAVEMGPYGVRANVIAAGYIQTDMLRDEKNTRYSDWDQYFIDGTPLGRLGRPEDLEGGSIPRERCSGFPHRRHGGHRRRLSHKTLTVGHPARPGRRSRRGPLVPLQFEVLQPPQDETGDVFKFLARDEAQRRHAAAQDFQRNASLAAREGGAETKMAALTELDVRVGVLPINIEQLRTLEHALVPVG